MNTIIAVDTLHELTKQESGLIIYTDNTVSWINWEGYYGIPRMLFGHMVALGEQIVAEPIPVDAEWVEIIRQWETVDIGSAKTVAKDCRAWKLQDGTIIVVSDHWH